jgi:GT2 family glycosyltransferase
MENPWPFISVIVPTYERAGPLSVCLGALAAQDYPRERFEIVVVDDGSVTSPEHSVERFRRHVDVRFLTQRHAGPAAARNYGASQAKGAFLAFTDDDCAPAHGWLRSLARSLASCPDSVVGGQTTNELPDNPYSTVSQLLVDYLYVRWNPDPQHATFFTSNNLALPMKAFQSVGGFDAGWTSAAGEDRDLCDRLIARGYRLIYAPDALVSHAHLLTWRTFVRQHANYGRGAYRLHQVRARRHSRGMCAEPLRFYLTMLVFPFSRTRGTRGALLAVLLAVAQAATAAGWMAACMNRVTQLPPGVGAGREKRSGFRER